MATDRLNNAVAALVLTATLAACSAAALFSAAADIRSHQAAFSVAARASA